jgi:hypothetical protein
VRLKTARGVKLSIQSDDLPVALQLSNLFPFENNLAPRRIEGVHVPTLVKSGEEKLGRSCSRESWLASRSILISGKKMNVVLVKAPRV